MIYMFYGLSDCSLFRIQIDLATTIDLHGIMFRDDTNWPIA